MNEGENSGMSNGPIFSSPNIAGSEPEKQQGPVPMPEQPVDVTKTDNPIVTTTLASMPGDEAAKPIVTSGGDSIDKKKPRFGLGTRRFKEKSFDAPVMQAAQTPAFANAPEFFNNAVGDIVLADAADAEKKNKTKKFIIIGAIAAVVVVLLMTGVVMLANSGKMAASAGLKKAYYGFANMYYYGEEKEDGLKEEKDSSKTSYAWTRKPNSEYADKLKTKYDAFIEYYKKNADKIKLGSSLTELDDRFAVLDARHRYDKYSNDELSELILSQGLEQAKASVEKHYDVNNVPSLVTAVLDNYKEESLIGVTIYASYAKYGCVKKGTMVIEGEKGKKERSGYYVDGECVSGKIPADERKAITNFETEIEEIKGRNSAIFGDTEVYLDKIILNIKNSIEGKK